MPQGGLPRRKRHLRYRIHMYAYASVSFALMTMGLIFSGFAIFKRDSEISKIWLAGPTTIAVGLVLCGKVIIDCRPRESAQDDESPYENEAEFHEVAPVEPEREKIPMITLDTKYDHAVKDGCLIENCDLSKRNSYHTAPVHFRKTDTGTSDLESEIWNLREDCASVSSLNCYDHYQSANCSMCLHNPCANHTGTMNMAIHETTPCAHRLVHSPCPDTSISPFINVYSVL